MIKKLLFRVNKKRKHRMECDIAPAMIEEAHQFMHSKRCPPHVKLGGHPINSPRGRPPNSPDLCSIEYVFSEWGERFYQKKPQTMVELKKICENEWKKIPQSFIQNVYRHMTTVYPWVVTNGGRQYRVR